MYNDSHYAIKKWLSWEEMAIILTLDMMNFSEKTYLAVSAAAFDALFPDLTPLSSYKPPPDKWHKANLVSTRILPLYAEWSFENISHIYV